MPGIATRLDRITESVIREMTRVADAHGAINLSQGFPDFDPPADIKLARLDLLIERSLSSGGPFQVKTIRSYCVTMTS